MVRARNTDACPGALQVHQAADGALVRVRLPGGMITAAQLATLSGVSSEFGSGMLELTARGNVQLRGITNVTAVAQAIVPLLTQAGLLPAPTSARTYWTTVSRCCWQGGTPAPGWPSATPPSHWSQSPCGSPRYAEKLG